MPEPEPRPTRSRFAFAYQAQLTIYSLYIDVKMFNICRTYQLSLSILNTP